MGAHLRQEQEAVQGEAPRWAGEVNARAGVTLPAFESPQSHLLLMRLYFLIREMGPMTAPHDLVKRLKRDLMLDL